MINGFEKQLFSSFLRHYAYQRLSNFEAGSDISPLATEAKIELLIKNVYSIQTQIIHNRTNYSTGPKQDQNTNQSFRNRYGPS